MNKLILLDNRFKKIVTIEEHSIFGGLYSIIAEKIATNCSNTNLFPIALPDAFGPTGTYNYLLDYHGLTSEKIAKKILKINQEKKLDID